MRKLLSILIIVSIFALLFGKLVFATSINNWLLFFYGILVIIGVFFIFFVALYFYKDPYETAKKLKRSTKNKYFLSCIVAVKNEELLIEKCIHSLLNQTYPHKEIIVVDDGSTDKTPEILRKLKASYGIKVITMRENVGKKKAIAQAILRAKGEIFAFSDSDSVLSYDALEKIEFIFANDPSIGAVSGHCRALNSDTNLLTKIQDTWYEGQFSVRKAFESVFGSVTCVSGPLAVFRREAIFNYIPAWENDAFLGQEFRFATDRTLTGFVLGSPYIGKGLKEKYKDSEFVTKQNYPTYNWKVVYSKAAKVWTNIPDSFSKVIRQQIRWKKSFIRNIFFTGSFYYRKPIIPAVVYYLHILFVLAGPIIVLRHLVYLPLSGNFTTGILYVAGILFVGFLYGLAYKLESKGDYKWIYRPLMSVFSTFVLSWLIYYSILTIKKSIWIRN